MWTGDWRLIDMPSYRISALHRNAILADDEISGVGPLHAPLAWCHSRRN
jgi:hypothetical protein